MSYTADEVMQYVENEDVKFIRLAFCDIFGRQKNISIMPYELRRAFEDGIAFDASAIRGFGGEIFSDLFLKPDPSTLSVLTWRPEQGKVVRMYCCVYTPDGRPFACDTRNMYLNAVRDTNAAQYKLGIVLKPRFRLYRADEDGRNTSVPIDKASCFDVAPLDGGENVRRQICLTLERMGITTKSSCHAEKDGQHEISFYTPDILSAADDLMTFITVVKAQASSNGLCAEFSSACEGKSHCGGLELDITALNDNDTGMLEQAYNGISKHIPEMMSYLDPEDSRYGRTQTEIEGALLTLHLPELEVNPYIVFSLLLYAAAEGLAGDMHESSFIQRHVPVSIIKAYQNV